MRETMIYSNVSLPGLTRQSVKFCNATKWKDSTGGTDYIPQESDYYADMTATKFEDSESYYSFTTLSLGNLTIKVPSYGKRNYRVKAVNKNNPEIVCWSDTYRAPDVDAE